MILSRELGKRIWGSSTNIENGGGGVSGDYIAGLLTGYATESWVDEHYISIDFFSRLFQAHGTENGSEIDVMPNDLETTITSVESMFGFWTNLYISALGSNGAAPAGISLGMLTDVVISGTPSAGQVLTYDVVTQKWINANAQAGATALANLTDVTLTSLQANQVLVYNGNTWINSSVKTINGNSIFGTGDIPASGGGGGSYLPLAGGTMTGTINFGMIGDNPSLRFYYGEYIDIYSNIHLPNANSSWNIFQGDTWKIRFFANGSLTLNSSDDRYLKLYGSTSEWCLISFQNTDNIFGWNILEGQFVLNRGIRIAGLIRANYGDILVNAYPKGNNHGIQFREIAFTESSIYNCSMLCYDHNGDNNPDGLSINGFDGVSICTGSNSRLERMRVTTGGDVGIGTTSPSYKLHVSGTIYATGSITALSDSRKKDITGEAGVTVEQIAHAPAVQFLWKDKERRKDGQQVGTLAQYWQTVLPEVVMDKGGELSMQYGVAALVSAIVTARRVVDHERRIHELEKENERLKEEISQLRLLN